ACARSPRPALPAAHRLAGSHRRQRRRDARARMGDAARGSPPLRPRRAPCAPPAGRNSPRGRLRLMAKPIPRVVHVTRSRLPRLLRATAVTLGRRVYWSGDVVPELLAHELEHVRQYDRHGMVAFLARYLTDYARGRLRGLSHRDA